MGLDMYLEIRKHFSGYEFRDEDKAKAAEYKAVIEAAGLEEASATTNPFATVSTTAIYWRKANAIHKWFVDTLADGVDECQEIHVPLEKLKELRDTCFEALSIPAGMDFADHADSVLPSTSGFFFGSTDYDDYYVQDLQNTMDCIDRLVKILPDDGEGWDWSLVYRASW